MRGQQDGLAVCLHWGVGKAFDEQDTFYRRLFGCPLLPVCDSPFHSNLQVDLFLFISCSHLRPCLRPEADAFFVWSAPVLLLLGMMSLMNLPALASLNISGCVAITDIGIMMVAQLTSLISLEMPWCLKVTNIGLSALTPLTKLANLNISGCQLITEQGIACLGTLTNLRRLGLLNLGYSKVCVTDAALQKLSSLTKLESLNLGLNIGSMQACHKAVTDTSMQLISSSFKQLTQLGLMSLDINDDGVKMLAQLSNLQVGQRCHFEQCCAHL